jgi:hypothetical protein
MRAIAHVGRNRYRDALRSRLDLISKFRARTQLL